MVENKKVSKVLNVKENNVSIIRVENADYISLTDLAKYKNKDEPSDVIKKWLSNFDTVKYIGIW